MKKVFVVGPSTGYACWLDNYRLVNNQAEADIVFFTGGCDINPALYNCKPHPTTWFSKSRDRMEVMAFSETRPDQLCIGTCRGAQLFTALLGGKLVQDISGHAGPDHAIKLVNNSFEGILPEEAMIISLHHQMMYPWDINPAYYDILYVSKTRRSEYYFGDGIDPEILINKGEPELIVYHAPEKPLCLGIQGHPEMMDNDSTIVRALNTLVNTLLF